MSSVDDMLSVRDHVVLQLAFRLSRRGRQRTDIYYETGYLEPGLWARVNWLLDQHAAHRAYPSEVARLCRLRDRRQAERRRKVVA